MTIEEAHLILNTKQEAPLESVLKVLYFRYTRLCYIF